MNKILSLLLCAMLLTGADRPLVIEAGQTKQLPAATSLQLQAPTTANATVNLPHGTAPTSPVDGDCWTTTAGLYCRVNSATVGPYATGTVSSVSVTTANGVSGTVATATTTPAITLSLGAITPSSVAASGTVTGSNLSGTNTGNQTITLTGDVTGSGTGSFASTLATVNSSPGTFGSATQSLTATVNGKGLITALSAQTVTPAASSITGGAALTKTDDTNVTLTLGGSPTTALLSASSITAGWTGTLAATRGGTGTGTYAVGDLLYASTTTALSKLADVATGNVLISGGVTTAPSWGKVDLTAHITGRLPFANLTQGSARSVLGVTGNVTADVASIQGTANQFLGVNSAGTALAFQTMAGDVTLSGPTATIATKAVTLAKMDDMATASLLGRNTAGTGAPEVLSASTARTLLGLVIGTNVQAYDADLDSVASSGLAAAWATTTPTPTPSSGAFTATGNIRAMKVGKIVFFSATVTITANGTAPAYGAATAWIDIALPYSSVSSGFNQAVFGREMAVLGISVVGNILNNSTTLRITRYDGVIYPGATGHVITISGSYEAA